MKKTFKRTIIIASLVGAFVATAQASDDLGAGKAASAMCGGCHGPDGNSVVGNFPKLAGQGKEYLVKQINDIKSGTRKVVEMTGVLTALSDQDISNIAAYYHSQTMTGGQAKKGLVEKGEALYRGGNPATKIAACTACHGPTGEGVALAKFPKLSGQHSDYIEKQLKNFRIGDRNNDGDSRMMRSVAAHMSDKEIKAVASYISGLH